MKKTLDKLFFPRIRGFLGNSGIYLKDFIWPTVTGFLEVVFDVASVILLAPLIKGIMGKDFSFVRHLPVFRQIHSICPRLLSDNITAFALIAALIFVFSILKSVSSYLSYFSITQLAAVFVKNTRNAIFSRYLTFGKQFFDQTSEGRLNAILVAFTGDVAVIFYSLRLQGFNLLTLLMYLTIMAFISWKLTLIVAVFLPLIYLFFKRISSGVKKISSDRAEIMLTQSLKISDVLTCLPMIKAYAKEEDEKKKFAKLSDDVIAQSTRMERTLMMIGPLQEIIFNVVFLVMMSIAGIIFLKYPASTVSLYIIFFYLLRRSVPYFNNLMNLGTDFVRVRGQAREILSVFDDNGKYFVPGGARQFTGLNNRIEFRSLCFSYRENVPVLRDLSFSIEKDKVTAIVGPTGSGKTTTVNLLLRLYDSPPGTIFIDGRDIRGFAIPSLLRQMAYVSQDTYLFNDTIRNNIIYGADVRVTDDMLADVAKKARLYEFIISLPDKFDTVIGDRGMKLSGGEKQRLSIARALMKNVPILILDEATSSLDSKTERLIKEAVDTAIQGKTAIVIAHRLSTIRHANKIVVIENGSVAEEGVLDQLLAKHGRFYQYWEEQKFY